MKGHRFGGGGGRGRDEVWPPCSPAVASHAGLLSEKTMPRAWPGILARPIIKEYPPEDSTCHEAVRRSQNVKKNKHVNRDNATS